MLKEFTLRTVQDRDGNEWKQSLNSLLENSGNPKALFQHLIRGIPEQEFFDAVFERQPVHFSRGGRAFIAPVGKKRKLQSEQTGSIFSRKLFLDLVSHKNLSEEKNMTVTKWTNGRRVDREASGGDRDLSAELKKAFSNGFTVQFYQPQRFADDLWKINASFEYVFQTLAGASAYLTPPGQAQGLEPHHDDVEVFVLQTEGRKTWRLYLEKSANLPDTYQKNLPKERLCGLVEVVLEEGDLLYLPRGVIHEAVTMEEFSTHVTISVFQHNNWKMLLNKLWPKLTGKLFSESEDFRKSLPVRIQERFGTFPVERQQQVAAARQETVNMVKSFLRETLDRSESQLDSLIDETVDDIVADFVENRIPPFFEANAGGGNSGSERMIDPGFVHTQVETGDDGEKEIALYSAWGNDRKRHMGHPAESDEEDGDEADEEEGDGEEDDEDDEMHTARFPLRLAPLVSAFRAAATINDEKKILSAVAGLGISARDVSETLVTLRNRGFLCSC